MLKGNDAVGCERSRERKDVTHAEGIYSSPHPGWKIRARDTATVAFSF
jgi:hypothetical protein